MSHADSTSSTGQSYYLSKPTLDRSRPAAPSVVAMKDRRLSLIRSDIEETQLPQPALRLIVTFSSTSLLADITRRAAKAFPVKSNLRLDPTIAFSRYHH
jgi:hypothetical protein